MGVLFAVFALLLGFIAFCMMLNKLWCFWSKSKVCLVGKTAIVTGGASGLGFQTALALAGKGCRVIIGDVANLSQPVEEIKKLSHNPNIIGKKVDFQSFQSVRDFARDIIETEPQLHILVNNAGVGTYVEQILTADGVDRTMQINYFSHFLLTHLLLDLLKRSAPSRIVFTSSMAAYVCDMSLGQLTPSKDYCDSFFDKFFGGTYSLSKLCMAGAAKTFGEKLKGTGITVNAAHPGLVNTPIWGKSIRSEKNIIPFILLIFTYFCGKNSEEGAQTLIHLTHAEEIKNLTGHSFYEGMKVPRPGKLTKEFCQKLWDESVRLTKLQSHEIRC